MTKEFEEFARKLNHFKAKLRHLPNWLLSSIFPSSDIKFLNSKLKVIFVGEVGVGKSSVLERLIGDEQLKFNKGPDCVTRRPVIIRFCGKNTNETRNNLMPSKESVQVITDVPILIDINIAEEVLRTPDEIVELEFVDLPGLTTLARPNQPQNYPQHTLNLFKSYTAGSDLIVLGLPADSDFTNSEALKLVRELKMNDQVIVFLSKLDLLDIPSGTNDIINFKMLQEVTEGFINVVPVKNAPQLETSHSLSILQLREDLFFSDFSCSNKLYEKMPVNYFGISGLREGILGTLEARTNLHWNRIVSGLEREKMKLEDRLVKLSDPNLYFNLISEYIDHVIAELSGESDFESKNETFEYEFELESADFGIGFGSGVGRRIGMMFGKMMPEALESINPFQGIDFKNLEILIKNSQVKN